MALAAIQRPMAWLLNVCYSLVGGHAAAIVVSTLLTKLILFPSGPSATASGWWSSPRNRLKPLRRERTRDGQWITNGLSIAVWIPVWTTS